MALNSVNTNSGALVALQNLQSTNSELATVQSRINTGKKVNSAKDNGAVWAIAQGQRSEVNALGAVKDSLARGSSAVDVSIAAGESVSDLLLQLKEKALSATDKSLTTAARTALNEDFKAIRDQITTVVTNAKFNGVNLLDNSTGTGGYKALSNTAGSTIKVAGENLSLGGTNVTVATTTTIGTSTLATTALGLVNASIDKVSASLARLGTGAKALDTHSTFVGKLSDALENGIGNLVDADLAKESARLQSLQTKQQLGVQALSIANQSSSILLGLFR
ncbi:Flagellin [Brevundimonas subvibrioides]|uniref:Flagellin n=1 Tax=Brevundimonas subvibrioides (strain ATCC 15264 / DSM 4735 / LMG 14903 / NBRC 16000 / CB 81) TaxID=633149 RepID=D9QLQ1_BRESC|nr:flagellin [Brevundimonas subvibrioides]ADL01945.1 flagellin domain protein [Brevundimonas subvibrioides ATCC 15264]